MHAQDVAIPLGRITGLRSPAATADAPRVLALHGWLDNAASFVPLSGHLDGIDLFAPDLPGHGGSVHLPRGAEYTLAGAIDAVLDIADALGWERFSLLGHSMGAGIASVLAAACPERVQRLVAIEALGALADAPGQTVERMRKAVAAARSPARRPLRVFPDLDVAVRARMQANGLTAPIARLLVERGVVAVEGGWTWSSDARLTLPTLVRMSEAQIGELVAGIGCPTRVVFADPPQPYLPGPVRSARARLLPDGDCVVVAGSHHVHMEDPLAVAGAIGGFLRD